MSQTPILADLGEALDSGDFEAVKDLVDELGSNYSEGQQDEKQLANRSFALYEDSGELSIAQSTTLFDGVQNLSSRRFLRVTLLVSISSLLANREQLLDEEIDATIELIQSIISEMQETEKEFEKSIEQSASIIEESIVPAQVAFVSTALDQRVIDPDETIELTATIENVGDAIAEEVTLSVSADSVSVDPAEVALGDFDGGTQQELSFDLTADTSGQTSVRLSVNSTNAGSDSVTRHLKVRDINRKVIYLQKIADSGGIITDDSLATATEDWRVGENPLNWLRSAIDAWRSREAVTE